MSWAPKRRAKPGHLRGEHRAFVVQLVQRGSIAEAARTLGTSRATVEAIVFGGSVLERTAVRLGARVDALLTAADLPAGT